MKRSAASPQVRAAQDRGSQDEAGFLLIALVVAVFIIALMLTVAAPTVARSLERDKEVESEHRAQQYVRAIHNYYLKFNSYPSSIDQLLNSNNQHFLREQYKDPLTGGDYRLIHFGEAKTQVKGFFGEPLDGTAQGSLGSLAGSASSFGGAAGASAGGTSPSSPTGSSTGTGFSLGTSSFSSSTPSAGATGAGGLSSASTSTDASGSSSSGSGGSISATQYQGSKGMIVGVGSNASGHGLVEWNGSANIEDWEFLYDHRTWLLKQRVSIFGGSGQLSGGPGTLGTNGSNGQGTGNSGFPASGQSGFGSGSGFGSSAPASSPAAGSSSTTP